MSNERITLQLFLGEIVDLINEGIMSSSWASKKKARNVSPSLVKLLFSQPIVEVISFGHTMYFLLLVCLFAW